MKKITKGVKGIVGASVMIGAGSAVLGGMGQGALIPSTTGKAAGMMGVVATAGMGMGVMDMVHNQSKKMNKRRKKY